MASQIFYQNTDACACLKKRKKGYVTCNAKPKKMQKGKSSHLMHDWSPNDLWCVQRNRETHGQRKCSVAQNRPIKPATASLCGFVVRLYHKMCFCRGNGSGSRGSGCQKITVYFNGLPLSGTVRMCNHKEISVPNELAGLSKQKARVAL